MKILFLSYYLLPDQTPGAFRSEALIKALYKKKGRDIKIDIMSSTPNRYSNYSPINQKKNISESVRVNRIYVRPHSGGFVDQAISYLYYVRGVLKKVHSEDYDLVFATSSRLMTSVLGVYIAKKKSIPVYIDIRDILLDTISDLLHSSISLFLYPILSILEKYVVTNANKINLVSKGFQDYFETKYPLKEFSFFPNGIDDAFIQSFNENITDVNLEESGENSSLNLLYAGNIGKGQALEKILPGMAKNFKKKLNIKVIGGGANLKLLNKVIIKENISNIMIMDPIDRQDLVAEYINADILFLHLDNLDCFKKVLPSKIFEYGATGKPILAGVSGYSAKFIQEEIENAEVFGPCNSKEALEAFSRLSFLTTSRQSFISKYSRKTLSETMSDDILDLYSIGE